MPHYNDVPENLKRVRLSDVKAAHEKDLGVQDKYAVKFLRFWVDEEAGVIFCLSESSHNDSQAKAHADANGLLPDEVYEVQEGE